MLHYCHAFVMWLARNGSRTVCIIGGLCSCKYAMPRATLTATLRNNVGFSGLFPLLRNI